MIEEMPNWMKGAKLIQEIHNPCGNGGKIEIWNLLQQNEAIAKALTEKSSRFFKLSHMSRARRTKLLIRELADDFQHPILFGHKMTGKEMVKRMVKIMSEFKTEQARRNAFEKIVEEVGIYNSDYPAKSLGLSILKKEKEVKR